MAHLIRYLFVCLVASPLAFAGNGDVEGNGGTQVAREFTFFGQAIKKILQENVTLFPEVDVKAFETALNSTRVVAMDRTSITVDGVETETDASNEPDRSLILVNSRKWAAKGVSSLMTIEELRERVANVFHEYLGIMKLEKNNYAISSRLTSKHIADHEQIFMGDWVLVQKPLYSFAGNNLGFQPHQTRLLTSNFEVVDYVTGKRIWQATDGNQVRYGGYSFSRGGKYLIREGSRGLPVTLFDSMTFQQVAAVGGPEYETIETTPDDNSLLIGIEGHTTTQPFYNLQVWNIRTLTQTGSYSTDFIPSGIGDALKEHVYYSANSKNILVSASTKPYGFYHTDDIMKVFDGSLNALGQIELVQSEHVFYYNSYYRIPGTSKLLVTVENPKNELHAPVDSHTTLIEIWDTDTQTKVNTILKGVEDVEFLAVSNSHIVLNDMKNIFVLDSEGKLLQLIYISDEIRNAKITEDESVLVVNYESYIEIYNLKTGIKLKELLPACTSKGCLSPAHIYQADLSPDKKYLILSGELKKDDASTTVWRTGL